MRLYTSTGTRKTIEQCNLLNVGLLMVADWRNPDDWPFCAVDNGCYSAYRRGVEWEPRTFLRILDRCRNEGRRPDFVVIPDKVASPDSLEFSAGWVVRLRTAYPGFRFYLAVQDGTTPEDVEGFDRAYGVDGLFVGGTMEWKLETMPMWCKFAHRMGMECHIGRIGPIRRMLMAQWAGADSIDSTTWVQRKGVLERYVNGYRSQSQLAVGQ